MTVPYLLLLLLERCLPIMQSAGFERSVHVEPENLPSGKTRWVNVPTGGERLGDPRWCG